MATLIPEPFPYLNTIEMNRPGRKVEYEVFKSLGNLFDEKSYVIYGPQHIRINKNKQLRDGEFIDFIIIDFFKRSFCFIVSNNSPTRSSI